MAEKKAKKAAPKKAAPKKTKVAAATATTTEAKTKKFQDYVIYTKRSGRFEVHTKDGKNVNGFDKAKILVEAKLVKTGLSKKAPPETTEATEAPAEETPAT
ncbi:MAG: hypothetical protein R3A80_11435 [Bdellovibrionota bacterium]